MTIRSKLMCLALVLPLSYLSQAAPNPQAPSSTPATAQGSASSYWLSSIARQGKVAFGNDPDYQIYRNVKESGATGDGITDDFEAINRTMWEGNRCGLGCDSSTILPAIVYFPPGTYRISKPIVMPYYTQMIGDAKDIPTIQGLPNFQGIALVDSDPYIPGISKEDGSGINYYQNQNNFFRQCRNFKLDLTQQPEANPDGNGGPAGIHWQVAQATSLQNIVFNMRPKSTTNKQQGIYMENGSGGFMTDLVFNGGGIGAFLGNQQFTSRNWTFNSCQTAVFMNWNWLWAFKSLKINDAEIGIDMSNLQNGVNQTVGSIVLMDSSILNTKVGIKTSRNSTSLPDTGGTLAVHNVDFSNTPIAIAGADGAQLILQGNVKTDLFLQGDAYLPSSNGPSHRKRMPQVDKNQGSNCGDHEAMGQSASTTSRSASTTSISASTTSISASTTSISANTTSMSVYPIPASGSHSAASYSSSTSMASNASLSGSATRSSIPSASTSSIYSNGTATASGTCPFSAATPTTLQKAFDLPDGMMSQLKDSNGAVFERSKPQYENVAPELFVSVKTAGAKGDGVSDDSEVIQRVFDTTTPDKIVYFDHGAYRVTTTIQVPTNIRITGEIWPLIMASGSFFADPNDPQPVFRVGNPGDTGNVEITELMFETMGPAPGAIMMQWNVQEASQGSVGMWDTHFRIGGSAGTKLQQDTCMGATADSKTFKPECAGSFLMMHINQQASAYLENCWFWVADHELDQAGHNKTNIYNGRGLLVESQGPTWLWGTSSEHSQLYNYQVANAKNIFMGSIQTETAYMQAAPDALGGGFAPNPGFSDPTFEDCTTSACKKTWGLRVVDSENVYVFGGGLYSFFDDYSQVCLDTESCQENMIDIECSTGVSLFGITTKASTNIVTVNGKSAAKGVDHINGFGQTLVLYQA